MTSGDTLPRWDMSGVFPGLESRELSAATEALGADLDRLVSLYDRHGVRAGAPERATAEQLAAFDEVVTATNSLLDQVRVLTAYLTAFAATDARNDHAATL